MNITIPVKPVTMDAPLIIINSMKISYTDIIIYGLFAVIVFIALAAWIISYKRGG
jgi:hypothetical protein